MTVDNGIIYLAFQVASTQELVLVTSSDAVNWSTPSVLCNGAHATNPSLGSFDGQLYLAYQPLSNGGVVDQLYYGHYGHGQNWQYSPSSLVANMGGSPPAISASEIGSTILYAETNSGDLCAVSQPNGGTWSAPEYVYKSKTLCSPAFCHIPYVYEAARRLVELPFIDESVDLPDPYTLTPINSPDSEYNWDNRPPKPQKDWGFTGVIAWRETPSQSGTLKAGTIIIFPGANDYYKLTKKGGQPLPPPPPYQGKAQINGQQGATPIVRPWPTPQQLTCHGQLCNLLMPDDNEDYIFEAYIQNFLGFSYRTPVNGVYGLEFFSGQLNFLYFWNTATALPAGLFSTRWRDWLGGACGKFYPQT